MKGFSREITKLIIAGKKIQKLDTKFTSNNRNLLVRIKRKIYPTFLLT